MKAWQAARAERNATQSRLLKPNQSSESGMFDDILRMWAKDYNVDEKKCFFCGAGAKAGKVTTGYLPIVGAVWKHGGNCQKQYNSIREEY